MTPSPLSEPPSQLAFLAQGPDGGVPGPRLPVLRGLTSWSGSATGSCLGRVGEAGLLPSEGARPGEKALEALQLLGWVPGDSLPPTSPPQAPPAPSKALSLAKETPPSFFVSCVFMSSVQSMGRIGVQEWHSQGLKPPPIPLLRHPGQVTPPF